MLSTATPSTRKPNGYLGAAAVGHSCYPANPVTFEIAVLDTQARPMEAPGS